MESLTGVTDPVTYKEIDTLYNNARNIIFPNFPIYEEAHRIPLQNLIMSHFLTREICMTPYARWQIEFNNRLNLIMPYYNKLYKAIDLDVNIFDDVNYTRSMEVTSNLTMEKGTTDTSTQEGTTTQNGSFMPGTTGIVTHTSTPQTNIADFLNDSYLSSADKSVSSGEDTSLTTTDMKTNGSIKRSGKDIDTEARNIKETYKGKRGGKSYLELLKDIQEAIFSVDNMILENLEDLFFAIY